MTLWLKPIYYYEIMCDIQCLVIRRGEGTCATWTAVYRPWRDQPTTDSARQGLHKGECSTWLRACHQLESSESIYTNILSPWCAPAQQFVWQPAAACSSACNQSWSLPVTLCARHSHWHPTAILPNRPPTASDRRDSAVCQTGGQASSNVLAITAVCRLIAESARPAVQVTEIARSYVSYMITCFVS